MGIADWFNQAGKSIAGAFSNGYNWVKQNIGDPITNFAKKIPIVGDVVRSFAPLGQALSNTANAAGQYSRGQPVTTAPKISDFTNGFKQASTGVLNGVARGASLYGNLTSGNWAGAARNLIS